MSETALDTLPPVAATRAEAPAGSNPRELISAGTVTFVVHAVFVISGIAALIYQVAWQRSLMMIYGSNIESVAMVVSAFLVGLGIGSIAGGAVSKKRVPLVLLFSGAELLIGLYGIISLKLFHWVGSYTLYASTLQTGVLAFALVFVPTLFMGATLPLLVSYRVNLTRHVGQSVSWLYFVNTLGAAIGAFAGTFFLLGARGLSGAVTFAAELNVISAVAILAVWLLRRRA